VETVPLILWIVFVCVCDRLIGLLGLNSKQIELVFGVTVTKDDNNWRIQRKG